MTTSSRRALLAAACGTCAATLTGCAYGSGRAAAAQHTSNQPTPSPPNTNPPTPTSTAPTPPPGALAAAADIPVGGGTVLPGQDVVVTQPEPGRFRAFSATCTHQGCTVNAVTDGVIVCPCHGGTFDLVDGAAVAGPPTEPLPERAIRVEDGWFVPA